MTHLITKAIMFHGSSITIRSASKERHTAWNFYFEMFYKFFNFGYKLCIIPFKFHVYEGKPFLKTSKFRKVIVLMSWIVALIYHYFKQRQRILVDSRHSNVLLFFNVSHALMHAFTFSLFYYEAFTRQKHYYQMMLTIKNCDLLERENSSQDGKKAKYFVTILHIVTLIGIPVLGLFEPLENNNCDFWRTFKWSVVAGKRYVFAGERTSYNINLSEDSYPSCKNSEKISLCEIGFAVIPYLLSLPYTFVAAFRNFTFVHPVVVLHAAVRRFIDETVLNETFHGISGRRRNIRGHVLQKYAQLKMLNQSINDCWAFAYFCILMDHILWLATDLNVGMKATGFINRLTVLWFFWGVIVLLIIASEVSRKMSIFQAWLSEKSVEIFLEPNEYAAFKESLQENGVRIGKPGLYKFDYNFMGQVVVLVVTLFIIALQSERSTA